MDKIDLGINLIGIFVIICSICGCISGYNYAHENLIVGLLGAFGSILLIMVGVLIVFAINYI